MDPKDLTRQLFDAIREANKVSIDAVDQIQKQNEKIYKLLLSQSSSAREEGNKMLEEWLETSTDLRKKYSDQLDDNLKKLEQYITSLE